MNWKKIVDFIIDNYWLLASLYCSVVLLMWGCVIPDDGSNLDTEKNIGTLMLMETVLLCLILHVWSKISRAEKQISELQGYLERLGGPDEAAEQDPPKMEEHL